MPAELQSRALADYLGRVRSHLPLRRGRDILRELESSIRDRIDDLASAENRAPDEDIVRRALAELGEPEKVAGAYVAQRSLVPPESFRAFLLATSIVFALHLALIGVATTLGRALVLGPVTIEGAGGNGMLGTVATVLHAICLDVGMMALVFAGSRGLRRRAGGSAKPWTVDVSPRAIGGRVVLTALVGVVLVFLRDTVFVVVAEDVRHPLFTEWFGSVVPLVAGVLVLSIASDLLYLVWGETRATLALDALHGVAGLACMLYLLRGDAILALPPIEKFEQLHGPVDEFLGQLSTLVVGFLALVFAVKTVRRLIRVAQL